MKVGMIMRRHVKPDARPVMPEVARLLREWGIDVHILDVEHGPVELAGIRVEHDLYVIKDKTPLALSLAATLHALVHNQGTSLGIRALHMALEGERIGGHPQPPGLAAH